MISALSAAASSALETKEAIAKAEALRILGWPLLPRRKAGDATG